MDESEIKVGYVYHIKSLYFERVQDDKLMRNHEGESFRPTYFCLKDKKTGLLWVVPMSSRVNKYQVVIDKDTERYGKCVKIVVANYADKPTAFLFQNMFPILPKYFNHVHTIAGRPMAVHHSIQSKLTRSFNEMRHLHANGIIKIFPDINRLEKLMQDELSEDKMLQQSPSENVAIE